MLTRTLPADFFRQPAPELAVALLGCPLVHRIGTEWVGGIISETEAYTEDDEASHSFRGLTPRNSAMFAQGGTLYVYRIYGMHFCLNISSGAEGQGEAVLIRGIIPIWGVNLMRQRRSWPEPKPLKSLCDGPGKLTQAMGINLSHNGLWPDATSDVRLGPPDVPARPFTAGPRIGITKNKGCPWRFCMQASGSLSTQS